MSCERAVYWSKLYVDICIYCNQILYLSDENTLQYFGWPVSIISQQYHWYVNCIVAMLQYIYCKWNVIICILYWQLSVQTRSTHVADKRLLVKLKSRYKLECPICLTWDAFISGQLCQTRVCKMFIFSIYDLQCTRIGTCLPNVCRAVWSIHFFSHVTA